MAYTTIDKPSDYFNTKLYAGNGTDDHAITGVDFQPDLTWLKTRASGSHYWFDNVRGATKFIKSDGTDAEGTASSTLKSFDTDGFTLGTSGAVNSGTENFTSWNWLASNTTASNTDGSITSTVSANTTSGFSIVSYTGNGTSGATVGHGLGVAPKMVILKVRNTTGQWRVGHISASSNFSQVLNLNLTNAKGLANSIFNSTAPSSTVFTLGNEGDANGSGNTFVAYCFAEKKGFSKFGSYVGNGSTDGSYIHLGFKPAFVMIKCTSTTTNWLMRDNKRDPFNESTTPLAPNLSTAESGFSSTLNEVDILSNGFKLRDTYVDQNQSGSSYIYMAFAENPFVTSGGIPTTAR